MLEQVERPISSHSSGLDLVLLRDENEVETKKVAELTQVLLISARHVTEPSCVGLFWLLSFQREFTECISAQRKIFRLQLLKVGS